MKKIVIIVGIALTIMIVALGLRLKHPRYS